MEENFKTKKSTLYYIDPRNIVVVEGFNSRADFDIDDLVKSIKENGVLNPISVIPFLDDGGFEKYRLVDGERRYRACMKAIADGNEIARIPTLFIDDKLSQSDLLVQQIVRNDGKPFNEFEMGVACQKFINWGWTIAEISRKLGKNCGCISYYLQHQNRDPRVQKLMKEGFISGADVRNIYKAHKTADGKVNEEEAVQEILKGAEQAKKDGKKKMSLKDLSVKGKTIVAKDTKQIKDGITKLLMYFKKYGNINLNLFQLNQALNNGEMIDDIFKKNSADYKEVD